MGIFMAALNQMAFLILLVIIGYLLSSMKAVPANASVTLSKLETNVFIPALMMGTFAENFTQEKFSIAWQCLLSGFVVVLISIVIANIVARFCTKDRYLQRIYTYGLSFPNFGFMGNAVVKALFPQIFMEYLIFTLPFQILIYTYGVPILLIPAEHDKKGWKARLKPFLNPMFISMLLGMLLGLFSWELPGFLNTAVTTLGSCMSPLAMLLTGMTIAKINLRATLGNFTLYAISVLRLLVIPILSGLAAAFLKVPDVLAICIVCCQAMPLGMNSVVIPEGYGLDTSSAAGMALISHFLSCLTIPLIFMLFRF